MLIESILDKKGADILLLDIRSKSIFTDYFLLCNGDNPRQLKALADAIAEDAKYKGETYAWGVEGDPESGWVLVDFGDLIVHIFAPEKRSYYNLEDLWSSGHVVLRMP
ncbi:MAG: ribosome silencing factor [Candidatus Promineifilaceae bacterium]